MANIKHVVSATSSAIVTSVGTVSNLFEWASIHSNESLQRSKIETVESRKSWASQLMLDTQKDIQTSTDELIKIGFTSDEIETEVNRITSLFNKR